MSEHTPGPWKISSPQVSFHVIHDFKGDGNYDGGGIDITPPVCHLIWDERNKAEAVANARLISTAPDGLLLARMVVEYQENMRAFAAGERDNWLEIVSAARSLIEKAGAK